jgi:hypothetical protein
MRKALIRDSPAGSIAARLAATLLFTAHLSAQTITGVVSGTIVDTSGLSVAGASVTLLNTATLLHTATSSVASGHRAVLLPSKEDRRRPGRQPTGVKVLCEAWVGLET